MVIHHKVEPISSILDSILTSRFNLSLQTPIMHIFILNFFISQFQECPDGIVQEDTFKDIYGKFFPHGSKNFITVLDV